MAKTTNFGETMFSVLQETGPLLKEMVQFLEGELSAEERDAEIVKNTMCLAKRQMTWFRRDKEIHWLSGKEIETQLEGLVEQHLLSSK